MDQRLGESRGKGNPPRELEQHHDGTFKKGKRRIARGGGKSRPHTAITSCLEIKG